MYDYDYANDIVTTTSSSSLGAGIWVIISLVIAIIGGICLYFTVFAKDKKYTGFMQKLYDFVRFDTMIIIPVLKITYIVVAIFITLASFSLISTSFLSFIICLVFGNLCARILYEFSLVLLRIYENTKDINDKMKKSK